MDRERGKIIRTKDKFVFERRYRRSGFYTRNEGKLFEHYVDAMSYLTFVDAERKLQEDINYEKSIVGY